MTFGLAVAATTLITTLEWVALALLCWRYGWAAGWVIVAMGGAELARMTVRGLRERAQREENRRCAITVTRTAPGARFR